MYRFVCTYVGITLLLNLQKEWMFYCYPKSKEYIVVVVLIAIIAVVVFVACSLNRAEWIWMHRDKKKKTKEKPNWDFWELLMFVKGWRRRADLQKWCCCCCSCWTNTETNIKSGCLILCIVVGRWMGGCAELVRLGYDVCYYCCRLAWLSMGFQQHPINEKKEETKTTTTI